MPSSSSSPSTTSSSSSSSSCDSFLVRPARIEDHDDLVPLFNSQSEILTNIYGEFFLAQIIQQQHDHNNATGSSSSSSDASSCFVSQKALVAEHNGRAIGLMTLTCNIDISLLQQCFHLETYDYFNVCDVVKEEAAKAEDSEQKLERYWRFIAGNYGELHETGSGGEGNGEDAPPAADVTEEYVIKTHEFETKFINYQQQLTQSNDHASAEGDGASESSDDDDSALSPTQLLALTQHISSLFTTSLMNNAGSVLNHNTFNSVMIDVIQQLQCEMSEFFSVFEKIFHIPPLTARSKKNKNKPPELQIIENSAQDNIFAITLFCLDEAFENRSLDFLLAAFNVYPTRTYCILTLPHTSPESQLLQYFSYVEPTSNNTFSHVLYTVHRDTIVLQEKVGVRALQTFDKTQLFTLVQHLPNANDIIASLFPHDNTEAQSASTPSSPSQYNACVVECDGALVGLISYSQVPLPKLNTMISEFAIQDFVKLNSNIGDEQSKHLLIEEFVLNPLFLRMSSSIFNELIKITQSHAIYYEVWNNYTSPLQEPIPSKPLIPTILKTFVQVRPRLQPIQPSVPNTHALIFPERDSKDVIQNHLKMEEKQQEQERENEKLKLEQTKSSQSLIGATISHPTLTCALHILTPSLISHPKTVINTRIVLIGASTCMLSFIETLLLIPDRFYSNITLVSPQGLPLGKNEQLQELCNFLPWTMDYTTSTLSRLALHTRIRIIHSQLINIDNVSRVVHLEGDALLPYDILVLSPGLQNQTPLKWMRNLLLNHEAVEEEKEKKQRELRELQDKEQKRLNEDGENDDDKKDESGSATPSPPPQRPYTDWKQWLNSTSSGLQDWQKDYGRVLEMIETGNGPLQFNRLKGIFALSSEDHISTIYSAFQRDVSFKRCVWLVAGTSLTALTAISGLLSSGVPAKNIHWLTNQLNASIVENDQVVLARIINRLGSIGVNLIEDKEIVEIKHEAGRVTGVLLSSPSGSPSSPTGASLSPTSSSTTSLSIGGLIGVASLDCDPYIFRSILGCGLVYDGRLVVNHEFRTVDPSIYAAGSIAKFSRQYGKTLTLENYDAREIGVALCKSIIKTLDSTTNTTSAPTLPTLGVAPKVVQALLPGGLLYFEAHTPTLKVQRHPKVLVTQNAERYCKLVFNDVNVLHSITYLGVSSVESENLIRLIGLPSSYMNRILFRYQQNQIKDLIGFLQGSWSTALYHESFQQLRVHLQQFMLTSRYDMVAIIDRVISMLAPAVDYSHDADVTSELMTPNIDPFLISQLTSLLPQHIKDVVQRTLLRFLKLHDNHLPGYVIPKPFVHGPQTQHIK